MAEVLDVEGAGLAALSVHCESVSAGLLMAVPVPAIGLPVQATSDAVGGAHLAVAKAVAVLAGRAQSSAVIAAQNQAGFVDTDAAGAADMAAAGASIPGVIGI